MTHTHLGLNVFSGETLSDDNDALTVAQNMSSALGIIHQSLDAADEGGVQLRFGGVVVHGLEEVEDAGEAVQLDEACHEAEEDGSESLCCPEELRVR